VSYRSIGLDGFVLVIALITLIIDVALLIRNREDVVMESIFAVVVPPYAKSLARRVSQQIPDK
jgi:hypothetical protein